MLLPIALFRWKELYTAHALRMLRSFERDVAVLLSSGGMSYITLNMHYALHQ